MIDRKMLPAVFAIALILSACSSKSSDYSSDGGSSGGGGDTAKAMTIDGISANVKGAKNVSGSSTAEIEAGTDNGINYFSPTVLTGTPGQTVKIELKNESDSVPHNFSIEDQNVNVDLDPGSTQTVSVTFPESGAVTFFCEYHKASGMLGELKAG